MTAFFPRTFYGAEPSFNPLFRLLDDFESYSREVQGQNGNGRHGHRHSRSRAFNPRFDVRETDDAYELHGELPGIERENVQIEFTEPQTLVIRGRVERTYASGTPPAAVQDSAEPAQVTEKAAADEEPAAKEATIPSHQATVTDEETETASLEHGTPVDEVAKKDEAAPAAPTAAAPQEKFWATERSIGEFSRTFSFPGRVDQDAVSASLQNGILKVVVPKAKKLESRRIAIS